MSAIEPLNGNQPSDAAIDAQRIAADRYRARIKSMITDAGPDADEVLMARLGR